MSLSPASHRYSLDAGTLLGTYRFSIPFTDEGCEIQLFPVRIESLQVNLRLKAFDLEQLAKCTGPDLTKLPTAVISQRNGLTTENS